jgi:hypothetical protein
MCHASPRVAVDLSYPVSLSRFRSYPLVIRLLATTVSLIQLDLEFPFRRDFVIVPCTTRYTYYALLFFLFGLQTLRHPRSRRHFLSTSTLPFGIRLSLPLGYIHYAAFSPFVNYVGLYQHNRIVRSSPLIFFYPVLPLLGILIFSFLPPCCFYLLPN